MMSGALPLRVRDIYGKYREVKLNLSLSLSLSLSLWYGHVVHTISCQALTGSAVQPPRWKSCVGVVNSKVGLAVGKPFLEETFDSQAKYKVNSR